MRQKDSANSDLLDDKEKRMDKMYNVVVNYYCEAGQFENVGEQE